MRFSAAAFSSISLTVVQLRSITQEHYEEIEVRLKAAIAKGAHKHFAGPSFPAELRLQVMKAGVLCGTNWWYAGNSYHTRTMHEMRNAALSSLLPSELWDPDKRRFNANWLDEETRSVLAETAEQAFLETAIFKIDATFSFLEVDYAERFKMSPLLMAVGARMHHLDLAIRVDVDDSGYAYDHRDILAATQCMKSLKAHFSNLKSCILTLDIHFRLLGVHRAMMWNALANPPPPLQMFDPLILQTTCHQIEDGEPRTLKDKIVKLFEAFVDERLGKSQFVRVRFRPKRNSWIEREPQTGYRFSCGPLVSAQQISTKETTLGSRLIDAAYQLERTGPRLLSQEPLR